jgi:2-polyprenyl-3-methyl-5-hydroxy-6-metoxy-1,4-benzoquinol methylase
MLGARRIEEEGDASGGATDYRERLYRSYVSDHVARTKAISLESLTYDLPLLRRIVQPFLPPNRDAEILDIGCGYGALVHCIAELGYQRVSGVDRSEEMVALARRLGIRGISQGDFLDRLESSPARYALITAIDVIEHQHRDNVLPVLDVIHGALRPGGVIVIQTPNAMSRYGVWSRYGDFTHEVIFDGQSIRQVLSAAGFTDLRVLPVPPCARGLLSAIRALYWAIREPWLKLAFALEAGWLPGQVFTPNLVAAGFKPNS